MANLIDGKQIANNIISELKQWPVPVKRLVGVLVGDDKASLSFLKQKEKTAEQLGVKFELKKFSDRLSQNELEGEIRNISTDDEVGGIIVQLPLPRKYERTPILNVIGIEKDVDVLNGESISVLAPAAGAVKRILSEIDFDLAGKRVVVVGPGLLIGRPVATWLMDKVIKLTVLGKAKLDIVALQEADLVVSGTGQAKLIRGQHIKSGAVVIDFGYGSIAGELTGDVDMKTVLEVAEYVTPTPGGTGPIVVAQLFENFFKMNM